MADVEHVAVDYTSKHAKAYTHDKGPHLPSGLRSLTTSLASQLWGCKFKCGTLPFLQSWQVQLTPILNDL